MAVIEKLSALKALKETKPGRYSDGRNLYLNIGRPAGRTFVFLYKDRATGKPKEMGIGGGLGFAFGTSRQTHHGAWRTRAG
jgi:hypothetical protein